VADEEVEVPTTTEAVVNIGDDPIPADDDLWTSEIETLIAEINQRSRSARLQESAIRNLGADAKAFGREFYFSNRDQDESLSMLINYFLGYGITRLPTGGGEGGVALTPIEALRSGEKTVIDTVGGQGVRSGLDFLNPRGNPDDRDALTEWFTENWFQVPELVEYVNTKLDKQKTNPQAPFALRNPAATDEFEDMLSGIEADESLLPTITEEWVNETISSSKIIRTTSEAGEETLLSFAYDDGPYQYGSVWDMMAGNGLGLMPAAFLQTLNETDPETYMSFQNELWALGYLEGTPTWGVVDQATRDAASLMYLTTVNQGFIQMENGGEFNLEEIRRYATATRLNEIASLRPGGTGRTTDDIITQVNNRVSELLADAGITSTTTRGRDRIAEGVRAAVGDTEPNRQGGTVSENALADAVLQQFYADAELSDSEQDRESWADQIRIGDEGTDDAFLGIAQRSGVLSHDRRSNLGIDGALAVRNQMTPDEVLGTARSNFINWLPTDQAGNPIPVNDLSVDQIADAASKYGAMMGLGHAKSQGYSYGQYTDMAEVARRSLADNPLYPDVDRLAEDVFSGLDVEEQPDPFIAGIMGAISGVGDPAVARRSRVRNV
jgi:hypothetical protein